MELPRCFISYSWDSDQHRDWVRKLATRLRECGVDAILDQFHCAPGMDLTQFMEESVRESDFVILVCTPNFARKADGKVGGVGYEKQIITGEMFSAEARETKFVPVLREGDAKESLPSYLKSRLFVDLRDDGSFETKLDELLRHFYHEPLYSPPPLGRKPDWKAPTISEPVSKPIVTKPAKKTKAARKPLLQETVTNSIGMTFVLIQAGSFMMGNKLNPKEVIEKYHGGEKDFYEYYEQELPRHEVAISKPFYLQSTQVTQSQWQKVMNNNPSKFKNCGYHCPVENVSWADVQEFIIKLNKKEGTDKYRLPTEAEWEYACRAGTTSDFSFGNNPDKLDEYAWFDLNAYEPHPVGLKRPNAWGLYDMHGNVWEWCQDWYEDYSSEPLVDPTGPSSGSYHVRRGGSCKRDSANARCSDRSPNYDNRGNDETGFRCVRIK